MCSIIRWRVKINTTTVYGKIETYSPTSYAYIYYMTKHTTKYLLKKIKTYTHTGA